MFFVILVLALVMGAQVAGMAVFIAFATVMMLWAGAGHSTTFYKTISTPSNTRSRPIHTRGACTYCYALAFERFQRSGKLGNLEEAINAEKQASEQRQQEADGLRRDVIMRLQSGVDMSE